MLIAMRLPFCSPFHVFLTSGHMLRELAWCGFRSWCKHEWTAVVEMASLRVWMPHPQTTVWRWQGLPTAPLWGTPYTFHPNIWPEESCFNENLFKLQSYNTNISQYLKGLSKCKHWRVSIYLEVQVFRHLRSEFWRCLLATLLRPWSTGLWLGSLRLQFSTNILQDGPSCFKNVSLCLFLK